MTTRKYLKDVLPRLYQETESWLQAIGRADLLEQLPHLFITSRYGSGSDFALDSDIPELSRENGSKLLHQPLYYDMGNGIYIGLSGADGLTPGKHEKSYISSFELRGNDYPDGYIDTQLRANGFATKTTMQSKN